MDCNNPRTGGQRTNSPTRPINGHPQTINEPADDGLPYDEFDESPQNLARQARYEQECEQSNAAARQQRQAFEAMQAPWRSRSMELTQWTLKHLVNRDDVWGKYLPLHERGVGKALTAPPLDDRGLVQLGYEDVVAHYWAAEVDDIIGLHSTSPENTCRWVAWDIDLHDDDAGADAQVNSNKISELFVLLEGLGLHPLLTDSNGTGGYHVRVIFSSPIPSETVYRFAQGMIAGDESIETFPKQRRLSEGKKGNWLRLPGRHHSRQHFTRVWGARWLTGHEAIDAIVNLCGDDPEIIIAEAARFDAAVVDSPQRAPAPATVPCAALAAWLREILSVVPLNHLEDYYDWIRIGMAVHRELPTEEGLAVWDEASRRAADHYESHCCEDRWAGFTEEVDNPVTMGTLVHWIQEVDPTYEMPRRPIRSLAGSGAFGDEASDGRDELLVLSTRRTLPTAEKYVRQHHHHADGPTLRSYAGAFWTWTGSQFRQIEEATLKAKLHPWLHGAKIVGASGKLCAFPANPGTVEAALRTMGNFVHVAVDPPPTCWLDGGGGRPDPRDLLACRNGLLNVLSGEIMSPTPLLFNTAAVDFDYDANAPTPDGWLMFLHQLWGDDTESIELLQEWFGYCLSTDTSYQKMMLIVGPRRAGKGTVGRVLTDLLGRGNVCAPTVGSLAGTFGLQTLIGKSVALVSDARFRGNREAIATVIERLLCISGEDSISVDRKWREALTLRLPTRFTLLTNELPQLGDASAAIASRFMILHLQNSFLGHENHALGDQLRDELPGILLWSLEGLRRLRNRGRFDPPQASESALNELEALSSPEREFVAECCQLGPCHQIATRELYQQWQQWCRAEGRDFPGTAQSFGRNLRAAFPAITRHQSTDGRIYRGIRSSIPVPPAH